MKSESVFSCLNCQQPIEESDNFCPNCGQENRDLKISFWEFISEFLSSNFNFDTKLGRTLVDLLFKPGEITRQFISGKRVRYVKPIQLYLFVSFFYFLLVGIDPPSFINTTAPSEAEISAVNESEIVEVNISGTELEEVSRKLETTDPENDAAIDSLMVELGEENVTPCKRHLLRQAIKSMNSNNEAALTKEVYANLSVAMLLLLPIFAMLLWVITKRMSPFYMDSLVFSVHFHSVALFVFSLNMMIAMLFDDATIFKIAIGTIFFYLILSIKRVFNFNWFKSIGKAILLSLSYSVIFGIAYLMVLLFSFWIY